MSDDFETYTRGKIGALRAEADQLERLLAEFLKTRRRAEAMPAGALAVMRNPQSGAERVNQEPRRRGNSAFGKVMEAISAAGPEGMSLDEMTAVAEREGSPIPRNTLRSQVWHEKTKGRLIGFANGRYAAAQIDPSDVASDLLAR